MQRKRCFASENSRVVLSLKKKKKIAFNITVVDSAIARFPLPLKIPQSDWNEFSSIKMHAYKKKSDNFKITLN